MPSIPPRNTLPRPPTNPLGMPDMTDWAAMCQAEIDRLRPSAWRYRVLSKVFMTLATACFTLAAAGFSFLIGGGR